MSVLALSGCMGTGEDSSRLGAIIFGVLGLFMVGKALFASRGTGDGVPGEAGDDGRTSAAKKGDENRTVRNSLNIILSAELLLEKTLKDTGDLDVQEGTVRAGAASSIGGMFSYKPKKAEKLLMRALKDYDPFVRKGAASSIGGMFNHNPEKAEKLLMRALNDDD